LGMTVRDIRPVSELARFEETLHNHTGGTFTGFRHRRKDGTLIDVDVEAQPITLAGAPARLVLARDMTSAATSRTSCARPRKWRPWASSPGASPTISTTCSPRFSAA